MYDIHTDHLDTPRVITDSSGTEVWRWDSAPFGETLPNEQPTNATSKFTFNIRFAGQYFDQETGLHYNYFRDYDPRTGRYVESDPIGLAGGMTTYGYVGANPVSGIDPNGLILPVFGRALAAAAACARNPACRTAAMAASAATAKAVSDICNTAYKKFKNWYAQDNNSSEGASNVPELPDKIVGDQSDPRAGQTKPGGKHTSGTLTPENGGNGDWLHDLETLAGPVRPQQPGDKAPPGSLVGENGVFGRPDNKSGGSGIDIPANGTKPHETLHYPKN